MNNHYYYYYIIEKFMVLSKLYIPVFYVTETVSLIHAICSVIREKRISLIINTIYENV